MAGDDRDTTRAAVKTYVPAYQKDEWQDHADRLDMSQSEFVRTMVQAGRREFEVPQVRTADPSELTGDAESDSADDTAETDLEGRVLRVLPADEYRSWDALVTRLTDDIEMRLDDALQSLQSAGRIRYSGREGGYVRTGSEDGE